MPRPEIPYPNSFMKFSCPIDNLPLRLSFVPILAGDIAVESVKLNSGHLHVDFDDTAICPNNHTWRLLGDLLLERQG